MAGSNKESKTARQAVRAGAGGAGGMDVTHLGEQTLVVPLNAGKHAYLRVGGRTVHVATASPKFEDNIKVLVAAGQGAKVRADLEALSRAYPAQGWADTLARLDEAGAFSA